MTEARVERTGGVLDLPLLARWHLLSLDAPAVAVAWTAYAAQGAGMRVPVRELLAMGLAVWVLYAADRLLDARGPAAALERRHRFHQWHANGFRQGIVVACVALVFLLRSMPRAELASYLLLGVLLAGWFALIHSGASGESAARRLPKEIGVGLFFAAAIFLPTALRAPWLDRELMRPALLFGALCTVNCLFISAWERASGGARPGVAVVAWLGPLLALLAIVAEDPAVALGACLLTVLHFARHRVEKTTLRALADVALLLPVLVLLVLPVFAAVRWVSGR